MFVNEIDEFDYAERFGIFEFDIDIALLVKKSRRQMTDEWILLN